jgi:hypothetical protein
VAENDGLGKSVLSQPLRTAEIEYVELAVNVT